MMPLRLQGIMVSLHTGSSFVQLHSEIFCLIAWSKHVGLGRSCSQNISAQKKSQCAGKILVALLIIINNPIYNGCSRRDATPMTSLPLSIPLGLKASFLHLQSWSGVLGQLTADYAASRKTKTVQTNLSPHPSPVTPAPFLELWGRVISMKALHACFCLSIFVKRGGVECQ